MCLAIPGKVVFVDGEDVRVKYPSEIRPAMAGGMNLSVGNYVLVQMGIVIKVLNEEEAKESMKGWQ